MAEDTRPYRPCVGVMVINREGLIFTGNRIDVPGEHWQMPQGGVDQGETPQEAAFRELEEETGLSGDSVDLIRMTKEWLTYDLPEDLSRKIWKGRYRGQKQKWAAFRFLGMDSEINLEKHKPEFEAWRWTPIDQLVNMTVEFKRDIYGKIVEEFSDLVKPF